jgi:hypothetical protein
MWCVNFVPVVVSCPCFLNLYLKNWCRTVYSCTVDEELHNNHPVSCKIPVFFMASKVICSSPHGMLCVMCLMSDELTVLAGRIVMDDHMTTPALSL